MESTQVPKALGTKSLYGSQPVTGLTLKEGDKVYLLRKNIVTKRPSYKLDYKNLGLFRIVKVKGLVNF